MSRWFTAAGVLHFPIHWDVIWSRGLLLCTHWNECRSSKQLSW
jgi:hypothetical protein